MAISRSTLQLVAGTRRRRLLGWLMVPAFLIVGWAGGTLLALLPDGSVAGLLESPAAKVELFSVPASFAVCAGKVRVDCVVDGDTFWLAGTKIRIADINTPEVSSPGCDAEAALGRRATARLRELLSAGPFELAMVDRDEDVYGRKLRVVERNGQSIGNVLVAEGLAHSWQGHKEGWC